MDRLEKYLDQVCRSIGGPRDMRQHVRQELREHLLDAVAQHQAAGMTPEQALTQALEDFGGPEQVRAELEATHGHRALAVVIDKAIEWKERTMKARWLWASWAYVGVIGVIGLEVLFIWFNVLFIIPRFQKLLHEGIIDYAIMQEEDTAWMPWLLNEVSVLSNRYTTFVVLGMAAAWVVFEWRVRSENKTFMRLSALGTLAVALMLVVMVVSAALTISFTLGAPPLHRMSKPFALEQVAAIEASVGAIEQARTGKDWDALHERAKETTLALGRLGIGPALSSLIARNERPSLPELRESLAAARARFDEATRAIVEKNAARLDTSLRSFRDAFEPIAQAAKRPGEK